MTYVVEQGPRVYIERINVVGNFRTEDYVIRREFRVAEGDAYNKVMVDQARQRLMGLGFFKDVKVNKEPGSAGDRVVLNVNVEEQSTGELSFSAGYSTAEGVIGDVTYSERNFMGTGQFVQVKLSGSQVSYGLDTSWTEPRFLDRNLSLGVDAFVRNADYKSDTGYTTAGYEDFKTGGSLRFGFGLLDNVWLNTNYTFMYENIYNLDTNAPLAVYEVAGIVRHVLGRLLSDLGHPQQSQEPNPRLLLLGRAGFRWCGRRRRLRPVSWRGEGLLSADQGLHPRWAWLGW